MPSLHGQEHTHPLLQRGNKNQSLIERNPSSPRNKTAVSLSNVVFPPLTTILKKSDFFFGGGDGFSSLSQPLKPHTRKPIQLPLRFADATHLALHFHSAEAVASPATTASSTSLDPVHAARKLEGRVGEAKGESSSASLLGRLPLNPPPPAWLCGIADASSPARELKQRGRACVRGCVRASAGRTA